MSYDILYPIIIDFRDMQKVNTSLTKQQIINLIESFDTCTQLVIKSITVSSPDDFTSSMLHQSKTS